MPGPLDGLKILDFTGLLPGPYATLMMADMGAQVTVVAAPGRPDPTTFLPPQLPHGVGAAGAWLGRGKRSIQINLKHPAARGVVDRLLDEHDVVMEQFRPGVMDRLGLGYEDLSRGRPGLIYCSLTGYGQEGPWRDRAGHDINYLALSGLMAHSGTKEAGPCLTGMQIADLAAGAQNAIIAILAAVFHRQRTGEGQHLDIAMCDGVVAYNALAASALLAGGREPEREDWMLNGGSLYDFYRTADGQWISFGGLEEKFATAFLTAIGRPDLAPHGVTPPDLEGTKAEVAAIIAGRDLAHWTGVFAEVDACVEPVLSLAQALEAAHGRGLVWEVEVPGGGRVRQLACPLRFSATPLQPGTAGGLPGAHGRQILAGLGYSQEEMDDLAAQGVTA